MPARFLLAILLFLFLLPGQVVAVVSDDFFTSGIDFSRWEKVDPLGDGIIEVVGGGSTDARLQIFVPAGQEHDLWTSGLNAPRLRQPCGTEDFSVEVKFDSPVKNRYQTQGLLAEGPEGALRFEFLGDGAGTRIFAAEIRPGIGSTAKLSRTIAGGAPLYMRLVRAGSRWTQSYSHDGQSWLTGASFTSALAATTIAVYGGNAGAPAPAHTALVDYFFDQKSPIVPEDGGGSGADLTPPVLSAVSAAPGTTSARISWKTDEPATGQVEYGTAEGGTLGAVPAAAAATSQSVELINLQSGRQYWFRIFAWDGAGNQGSTDPQTFRTLVPAPCQIDFWYGPSQVFGSPGVPQTWVNILGDVAVCPDLATLSYRLNGGAERLLSVGPDGRRLASAGDFNADIAASDLRLGNNLVEVIARDAYGQATTAQVMIDWRGERWPLPFHVDWRTVGKPQDAVQVIDGKWQIGEGRIYPLVPAYDRLFGIGDIGWRDYEATVPITIAAVDPAGFNPISTAPGFGVQLRWNGHTTYPYSYNKQPLFGWLPVGATAWYGFGSEKFKLLLNGRLAAEDSSGKQVAVGDTWIFKARVETRPSGEPWYQFKFWKDDESEPAGWLLAGTGYTTDPVAGSLLLVAHHVDARFGEITIVPIGYTAPTTCTLTTSAEGSGAVIRSPDKEAYTVGETVALTATPAPGWQFESWDGDLSGTANPASLVMTADRSVTARFAPLPSVPGLPQGDEFNGMSLDPNLWTFINPRGDAAVKIVDGRAAIVIPSGVEHDLWSYGNYAPRLVQNIADGDFDLTAKFDSPLSARYQMQGVVIEGPEGFVRIELLGDGTSTRLFTATIIGDTAVSRQNSRITGGAPLYLRLKRAGDTWSPFWSTDGTTWTAGVRFTQALSVATVGIYGGNAGGNPAHTALVDWVRLPAP